MEMQMNTNNSFDEKDSRRVSDIIRKAGGQWNLKARRLTEVQADSIDKADKALRRCRAAEDENYHDMAAIFRARYERLTGAEPTEADTAEWLKIFGGMAKCQGTRR
jgi:hypothetical protein